mgnify:FL=1
MMERVKKVSELKIIPEMALDPSVYGPVLRVENALSDIEINNLRAYTYREKARDYKEDGPKTRSTELYQHYGFTTTLAQYLLNNYRGIHLGMDDMINQTMLDRGFEYSDPKLAEEPLMAHETLRESTPGVNYKSHTDLASKKLTCLIYLEPKSNGDGTIFHGYDNKHNTEHTWQVNTGYIFKPNNFSYHSYRNTRDTSRWVYMINLFVDKDQEKFGIRRTFDVNESLEFYDSTEQDNFENHIDKKIPI